jgi:hypothetical protein
MALCVQFALLAAHLLLVFLLELLFDLEDGFDTFL